MALPLENGLISTSKTSLPTTPISRASLASQTHSKARETYKSLPISLGDKARKKLSRHGTKDLKGTVEKLQSARDIVSKLAESHAAEMQLAMQRVTDLENVLVHLCQDTINGSKDMDEQEIIQVS
jgi:hypothetical protein